MTKIEIENEIINLQRKLFTIREATKVEGLFGADGCYYEDLKDEIRITVRLMFLKDQLRLFK